MIRSKIKEIVANIDKFESHEEYIYTYKNIRINSLLNRLRVNDKKIELSLLEELYLFRFFKKADRKIKKHLENCKRDMENKALNSIVFNKEEKKHDGNI